MHNKPNKTFLYFITDTEVVAVAQELDRLSSNWKVSGSMVYECCLNVRQHWKEVEVCLKAIYMFRMMRPWWTHCGW